VEELTWQWVASKTPSADHCVGRAFVKETLRRRNFASRPLGSVQFLLRLGFEQICDVFSLISGNAGLDLEKQVMGSNLP